MEVHGRQPNHHHEAVDRLRRRDEARSDVKPGHGGEPAEKAADHAEAQAGPDRLRHLTGAEDGPRPVQRYTGGPHELTEDVVELSEAAEALNALEDPERAGRVHELKRLFEDGSLLTADRLEKAALGILRG